MPPVAPPTSWSPAQIAPWLAVLAAENVAIAPAEGVYGYVADPFSDKALRQLLFLKQREEHKGFIVLIARLTQLARLSPALPILLQEKIQAYIDACWLQPTTRPVTLLLPALPTLPALLTGGQPTIAVRLPQPAYMQGYLGAWAQAGHGPLVSTSLNLSGQQPAVTAAQATAAAPSGIPSLLLAKPLSGETSRLFNPLTNTWLR